MEKFVEQNCSTCVNLPVKLLVSNLKGCNFNIVYRLLKNIREAFLFTSFSKCSEFNLCSVLIPYQTRLYKVVGENTNDREPAGL